MSNKNNHFLDFLYDAMDYILMFFIVIAVVGVIGWRLNLLFNRPISAEANQEEIVEADLKLEEDKEEKKEVKDTVKKEKEKTKKEDKKSILSKDTIKKEDKDKDKKVDSLEEVLDPDKVAKEVKEPILIEVPSGANSSSIGDLLESRGIIKNASDFTKKCDELEKSTKLKAGEFQLTPGDSLENIIGILTK